MTNKIKCPKCGEEIDIENIIQKGAKDAFNKELKAKEEEFLNELSKLKKENETIVLEAIKKQKEEFREKESLIKKNIMEEQEEAFKTLKKELDEKTSKIKEMNKLKADMLKLEREKEELKEKISLDIEKEFSIKLIEEKQKMQKMAEEKFELEIIQLKKQLQDQKDLTEEMKKRQEQGSMQLQGEIQELAIEKYLKENFVFDEIKEIAKGDMGADSIQIINTNYKTNCGSIYYESKRTKTFKNEWISKFKNDIQTKGADIGVLVTAIYPKDMIRMGMKDGIYICSYEEFKALSYILRDTLIKINETKMMQKNKHTKSELLYNYLTSTEFRFCFENIVKSFVSMQNDLDSEKRAMAKLWKKREVEIKNVLDSLTDMYGSIQGISGNAIEKVEALELPLIETDD